MESRRKFLRNATGLIATGIVSGSVLAKAKPTGKFISVSDGNADAKPISRTLGRTGIKLPIVSMGVMNSSNPNLLKVAWQQGMRHFDTAWIYQAGNNEKMVGSVIKELKIDRKDVVITTKIVIDQSLKKPDLGAERKKQFLSRFAQSLERLQMDYVDILMLHDVSSKDEILDPVIMQAMKELKEQGKVKFAGFSTHVYWPEILTAAADKGFYDAVLISLNYAMSGDDASHKAIDYAASKGVGLIAMKTQCQQDWYKNNLSADAQKYYEGSVMHTALLKWVLRHEQIATAVPGFTTFEQLQTDIGVAFKLDYTADEKKFLEDHNVKLALQSVCRFCGECRGTCPKGVDIPSLMRTHSYAMGYGNMHMTHLTLGAIPQNEGLAVCRDCDECVAQCKHNVQIAGRIEELAGSLMG